MLLILQILFFVLGALVLLTGRAGLTHAGLKGNAARLIGLLLAIPLLVSLILFGVERLDTEDPSYTNTYHLIEWGITIAALLGAGAIVLTAPRHAIE